MFVNTQFDPINVCFVQVLARAREQGEGEECGGLEEGDSGESSEEEDIVTDFPINNGNTVLGEVKTGHDLFLPFIYTPFRSRHCSSSS